jgi:hypothetical protein
MVEYKGGRCAACSYDRCLRALCFHHVDAKSKSFNFAGSHLRSRERLWEELDKCVLLCLNCHAEAHAGVIRIPTDLSDLAA